jgi:ABC-2 type transport system ATP-binding protein
MSGRQVLKFFSQVRPECDFTRALRIAERLDLNLSRWVLLMSTGMRQKLALAAVLAVEQPLLILDEPTTNLDPTVRGVVLDMIREAQQAGRTVIFSSHVLSEIEDVCDRVVILRQGRLVHDQSIRDLMKQHRVIAMPRGPLASPPPEYRLTVQIRQLDQQRVQIDSPDSLHTLLRWLSECPLQDLQIQPIGLRAIYDQYHAETECDRD